MLLPTKRRPTAFWRKTIACLLWAVLLAGAATLAPGQSATTGTGQQRKTSTPYTGDLTIFDYPEREQKLHINQVMGLLGIGPGKAVADIGAGSGWVTVGAAKRGAPEGPVAAVQHN